MANWDKINNKFNDVISNITDEEWNNWIENIDNHRRIEKIRMIIEAKLYTERLKQKNKSFRILLNKIINDRQIKKEEYKIKIETKNNVINNTNHPLAA